MSAAFLDETELAELTGRKMKSRQIAELRRQGVAFFINATGHPVVARAVIEGRKDAPPEKKAWTSKLFRAA